jgi:cytochrome c-type biogenesis protein
VPGYLSAVTGISVGELDRVSWRRAIGPSLVFVASFSAVFNLLGLTATGIGQTLQHHRDLLGRSRAS